MDLLTIRFKAPHPNWCRGNVQQGDVVNQVTLKAKKNKGSRNQTAAECVYTSLFGLLFPCFPFMKAILNKLLSLIGLIR